MLDVHRNIIAARRKSPGVTGRYFPCEAAAHLERHWIASLG